MYFKKGSRKILQCITCGEYRYIDFIYGQEKLLSFRQNVILLPNYFVFFFSRRTTISCPILFKNNHGKSIKIGEIDVENCSAQGKCQVYTSLLGFFDLKKAVVKGSCIVSVK